MKRSPYGQRRSEQPTGSGRERARRTQKGAVRSMLLVSVAALLLAACGGSSSLLNKSSSTSSGNVSPGQSAATETGQGSTSNPNGASIGSKAGSSDRTGDKSGASGLPTSRSTHVSPAHDAVTRGAVISKPVAGTGGTTINDDNPKQTANRADSGNQTSTQANPCTLISKADAEALIRGPIAAPREAPLGPTCIYQPIHGKSSITLSVESINFAKIKPHMRQVTQFTVHGHAGYCGKYGQAMTFVPLAGGKVLNITAPCSVGTPFAARAIARLTA